MLIEVGNKRKILIVRLPTKMTLKTGRLYTIPPMQKYAVSGFSDFRCLPKGKSGTSQNHNF
jgi:hypothetical protein